MGKSPENEAMDVDDAPSTVTPSGDTPPSLLDKLVANSKLLEAAAASKESRLVSSRLLRSTAALKKELTGQGIADFAKTLFGGVEGDDAICDRVKSALAQCETLGALDWAEATTMGPTISYPEYHELYVYLIASQHLVDQTAWNDALRLSQIGIQVRSLAHSLTRPFVQRLYYCHVRTRTYGHTDIRTYGHTPHRLLARFPSFSWQWT